MNIKKGDLVKHKKGCNIAIVNWVGLPTITIEWCGHKGERDETAEDFLVLAQDAKWEEITEKDEKFQTRPHDYTGCHPDIAAALKRGEEIYCDVWDKNSSTDETFVTGYDLGNTPYPYRVSENAFENAEPIPAMPEKKTVTLELTDAQLAKIKEVIGETE